MPLLGRLLERRRIGANPRSLAAIGRGSRRLERLESILVPLDVHSPSCVTWLVRYSEETLLR